MRDFIDVTGKTEEEAIRKALEQLNVDRFDVSVEVLERAKSGFLGIGAAPAKVRVYYGEEEEIVIPAAAPVAPKAEKPQQPRKEKKAEKSVKQPKQPKKTEKPAKAEKAVEKTVEKVEKPAVKEELPAAPVVLGEEVADEKSVAIKKFLSGLLEQMDVQAEIKVYMPEKGRYKVILEGEKIGAIIGRRGETLDAIQQLTSYSVNRTGGRARIQLDAEGYRDKREQSLQHLAHKVAAKVVKYRRSVTLEPMNAYERHVIHTALQDVAGVMTYSTGTDPNRRVIVAYDREKK
ncbi:MAG: Jag N-terminal domain-containing protein [Oscillibacter sp.]|nr:Jag N-terminal domain-containing protein [Oscillibacter sp.]